MELINLRNETPPILHAAADTRKVLYLAVQLQRCDKMVCRQAFEIFFYLAIKWDITLYGLLLENSAQLEIIY